MGYKPLSTPSVHTTAGDIVTTVEMDDDARSNEGDTTPPLRFGYLFD